MRIDVMLSSFEPAELEKAICTVVGSDYEDQRDGLVADLEASLMCRRTGGGE